MLFSGSAWASPESCLAHQGAEGPTALQRLSGYRELSALRSVLACPRKASALRESAAVASGTGPAWIV